MIFKRVLSVVLQIFEHKELPPNGTFCRYHLKIVMMPKEGQISKADEEDEDWVPPTPRRTAGTKSLRDRPKKVPTDL